MILLKDKDNLHIVVIHLYHPLSIKIQSLVYTLLFTSIQHTLSY